jgi:hypothetical protein
MGKKGTGIVKKKKNHRNFKLKLDSDELTKEEEDDERKKK